MSMRIERSSLDQVKRRFEVNKKKLEEKKKEYHLEQRMKEIQEEVSFGFFPPLSRLLWTFLVLGSVGIKV